MTSFKVIPPSSPSTDSSPKIVAKELEGKV